MFTVGTPEWSIWHLKAIGLPRLVDDLEHLERTGIAETKCKLVREALKAICEKTDAAVNSNWKPCVSRELHQFREVYTKWNDRKEGVDLVDRMHRREQVGKLRDTRGRMSRNMKKRSEGRGGDKQSAFPGFLANKHDQRLANDVYGELKRVALEFPDTFPILRKAVVAYEERLAA